ncbi:MAG: 3-deoxy-7-phosphoheptulonate synthase [Candidatus Omnitrophica bacterium]|nr:3-deoxy-7-phosphoheptulonate synthase [Candidatus Omnitrophota bacterium]
MKDISSKDMIDNLPLITRKDYTRKVCVGGLELSKDQPAVIAGPCTVESKTQIMEIAKNVKSSGAKMLRGGVFKPLTFPYGDPLMRPDSDSGITEWDRKKIPSKSELYNKAELRLGYLKEAGEKYGLPVVSEVLYADSVGIMSQYVDMFQLGYRHMFNMDLIEALSATQKPIMIKRHYGESIRSLLGVMEHFEARGKHNFICCERGVAASHTHNAESRAIIDIQAICALNEYAPSVLVFIDPSHATFKRGYVRAVSMAAIAAGADGLLIEVHPEPEKAWVDPLQALGIGDFDALMKDIARIEQALKRN